MHATRVHAGHWPNQRAGPRCPRWDSNPHSNPFKGLASAGWATGAAGSSLRIDADGHAAVGTGLRSHARGAAGTAHPLANARRRRGGTAAHNRKKARAATVAAAP
jgi:hypothetical protein